MSGPKLVLPQYAFMALCSFKSTGTILPMHEIRKNCHSKEFITVQIYGKGTITDCSNYRGIFLLSTAYKVLSTIFLARLTHTSTKFLVINSVGSVVIDILSIKFCMFGRYQKEMGV
jgi:hypothetical protein